MKDHVMPPASNAATLPSTKSLLKAAGWAVGAAAVILVLFVLPAEYNIDPTGLGSRMGLTELSKPAAAPSTATLSVTTPSVTTSAPTAPPVVSAPTTPSAAAAVPVTIVKRSAPFRHDTMTLTLKPRTGSEIKATMKKGETMVFSWTSDSGPLNVDMHGDPPNAGNDFTSYWKEKGMTSGHGVFVAPFDGEHGWYWGNRGPQPVTVTVTASGYYDSLMRK